MSKVLIIQIPLEAKGNDLEDTDFDVMVEEAKQASGIHICVGRSISEEESHISRQFEICAEVFDISLMHSPAPSTVGIFPFPTTGPREFTVDPDATS